MLGLARSGVAASRFLADAGAVVAAYDRRPAAELADAISALGARPVRLALDVDEAEARRSSSTPTCWSPPHRSRPGFPTTDPWLREALRAAEARGAEVISEVDLFLRLTRARIGGVTGTKGKTTTASLLAADAEAGGITTVWAATSGLRWSSAPLELGPGDWVVLELCELQLPTISRGADVALYTNIAEDHLDRHGTVEAYRAVKARLAELTRAGRRVVLNHDDPGCRELGERLPPGVAGVVRHGAAGSRSGEAWLDDGWVIGRASGSSPPTRCRCRDATCSPTSSARRWRAPRRRRRRRDRRRGAHLRRRPAPARDDRRARWRALGQRLAGDDPAGGDRRARGLRRADSPHRRRQGQGPRVRRLRRCDRSRGRAVC